MTWTNAAVNSAFSVGYVKYQKFENQTKTTNMRKITLNTKELLRKSEFKYRKSVRQFSSKEFL